MMYCCLASDLEEERNESKNQHKAVYLKNIKLHREREYSSGISKEII